MRRSTSEMSVGLQHNLSQSLHKSHRFMPKSMSGSVVLPQDIPISSKVTAIIKKAHEQSQMLKGRLSILQIQEHKNEFKAKMNSKKYNFHQHMRAISELEQQQKAENLKKVMQKLSQTKQQAQTQRIQHRINLQNALQQIQNKKQSEYKKSKERAEQIRNSIVAERRQEESLKKQRAEEIREYKKMQRKNVINFLQNKKKSIKHQDSSESLQLSSIAEQRRRQIYELAKLQSEMLQRHARSRQISDFSESKLRKLLESKNQSRCSQRNKLPSINTPKNISQSLKNGV